MVVVILLAAPTLFSFCLALVVLIDGVLAWREKKPTLPPARVKKLLAGRVPRST